MQSAKADPSLLQSARNTEPGERFNRTLFAALDALDEKQIPFALIGGVASSGMGRPRSTHDIDVFLRPEDAGAALVALEQKGFRTEKTDFAWLFKAFKEEILVDIIFKSRGDIYFDREMAERAQAVEYHGREVRMVAPEDLVIIKCAVADEVGPHHWHDALALLSHAKIDWDYLARRARRAPRRLLALLLYAQSSDIWVPNKTIFDLFRTVYGATLAPTIEAPKLVAVPQKGAAKSARREKPDTYVTARLTDAISSDERIGGQDLKIRVDGKHVLVRGEVPSAERVKLIEKVIHDLAPELEIDNQIKVAVFKEPDGAEEVR